MHYHLITIFPEIFESFLATSLLAKAREKQLIDFSFTNPRDFCTDKQRQVDDQIYGGGAGLLMKAQPLIDAIREVESRIQNSESRKIDNKKKQEQTKTRNIKILLLEPSLTVFDQQMAHTLTDEYTDLVLICGRYEGIDHRVELRCRQQFGDNFSTISLGQWVTLGGEAPAMCVIEATARLLDGVIKEPISRQDESYRPEDGGALIEYPQYTRPEEVEGMRVPDILLSGHHAQIEQRRRGEKK